RRLSRRARPDAVSATGVFVRVPPVAAARVCAIPSLRHEQTAIVGLANRINARFCNVLALTYDSSAAMVAGSRARTVVTGNPIRPNLLDGDPETVRDAFGFDPAAPLIYVTGGALGAQAINNAVREALPNLLPLTQVLHQC